MCDVSKSNSERATAGGNSGSYDATRERRLIGQRISPLCRATLFADGVVPSCEERAAREQRAPPSHRTAPVPYRTVSRTVIVRLWPRDDQGIVVATTIAASKTVSGEIPRSEFAMFPSASSP